MVDWCGEKFAENEVRDARGQVVYGLPKKGAKSEMREIGREAFVHLMIE